ncbi:hypothetical protein C1I95_24650 [Micromonospora craterilacus]|uniref:DNA-binding protein n=1 Tax=Micromonospora craterilacus TaxID=1655439 RepID=A0A2W2EH96_9ACTN|nr:hypothetical protein [Micromonospora craterilacus]PZG13000.1 hypothetical protein C1I95_24650 [Micromonospora craterilacus]
MAGHDPADVERRLRAGERVTVPELAAVFERDRTTVYRWVVKRKLIKSRMSPGGGEVEIEPEDALRALANWRAGRPLDAEPDREA